MGASEDISTALATAGVPAGYHALVLSAIDSGGYDVVSKEGGSPASVIEDAAASVRLRVDGVPGTYLIGVSLGTRGWLVWRERTLKGGSVDVSQPMFVSGAGELVIAEE